MPWSGAMLSGWDLIEAGARTQGQAPTLKIVQVDRAAAGARVELHRVPERVLQYHVKATCMQQLLAELAQRVEVCSPPLDLALELLGRTLAVGDVADDGGDEQLIARLERTQADLDGKQAAILALRDEVEANAHRSRMRLGEVPATVTIMQPAQALGYQHLDRPADHLATIIAEEPLHLRVHDVDLALSIHDHDRIRRRLEQALELGLTCHTRHRTGNSAARGRTIPIRAGGPLTLLIATSPTRPWHMLFSRLRPRRYDTRFGYRAQQRTEPLCATPSLL